MAIDLEEIMNRVMNMVEKKQKDMPSGMQMYNDAQTQYKNDAIDKVSIARDQFASNERAAQLAHPASSLDFRGREAYANAAIGKMNAEAQHNLGMAAQGYGVGNYQNAQAAVENKYAQNTPNQIASMRTGVPNVESTFPYSQETIDSVKAMQSKPYQNSSTAFPDLLKSNTVYNPANPVFTEGDVFKSQQPSFDTTNNYDIIKNVKKKNSWFN